MLGCGRYVSHLLQRFIQGMQHECEQIVTSVMQPGRVECHHALAVESAEYAI